MMTDIQAPVPQEYEKVAEKLGRLPAIDERDRRFSMLAPRTDRTFRSWLSSGPAWDQGATSQCVAYAANRLLLSHNTVNKPLDHVELYRDCQDNDEWPGNDYSGTSVRAAMKVLKQRGLIESYSWAFEPEQVIRHTLEVGPVVLGVDWTTGMFTPVNGYITPGGEIVGGHAILGIAVNRRRQNPDGTVGAIRLLNSWGSSWGEKGRCWLSFYDLGRLMRGLSRWPGEAATATEIRVR